MRALICALLVACGDAHADEWTGTDKAMLGAAVGLLVIDWGQTRDLVNGEECTRWVDQIGPNGGLGSRRETYQCRVKKESNPLLGDYPSRQEVDRYFALALLGTVGLAYVLPAAYRKYFLGGVIVIETVVVLRNHRIGLRVNF